MQFKTELLSATWESGHWRVCCSTGDVFITKYLITSLGLLTKPNYPDIPGLAEGNFNGKLMHSSAWDASIDVTGKRVGIIGCGSSGTQLTTTLVDQVKELHCFIRRPQYSVPAGFRPVSPEERKKINERYDAIWSAARRSVAAGGFPEATIPMMSVSNPEINSIHPISCLPQPRCPSSSLPHPSSLHAVGYAG
jgi:cyclohexanone monooxygenase